MVAVGDKRVQVRRLAERERQKMKDDRTVGEKEKVKLEELKGRVGSQGGVLGKVGRALVREGVDVDVEMLEVLAGVKEGTKEGGGGERGGEWKGRRNAGRGIILWNDDHDHDDTDNMHDNDKDNHDNSLAHLRADVGAMVRQLERQSPRWWAWTLLACPPLALLVAAWSCVRSYRARRRWERDERYQGVRRRVEEMEKEMLERVEL